MLGHKEAGRTEDIKGKEVFKGQIFPHCRSCKESGFNFKSDGKPVEDFETNNDLLRL